MKFLVGEKTNEGGSVLRLHWRTIEADNDIEALRKWRNKFGYGNPWAPYAGPQPINEEKT